MATSSRQSIWSRGMRLSDHLFESTITDMAREFVQFQNYINSVMDRSAKNPEKAKARLRTSFQKLEGDIKKALREK